MIIVDRLLAERVDDPVRVGLAGAGFMARGLVLQIALSTPGMEVVAVLNRHADRAVELLDELDVGARPELVSTAAELDAAVAGGAVAVTDSVEEFAAASCLDAVIDATGAIEWGARLAVACIEHRVPLVLMNAELDATVGPLLSQMATEAGSMYSGCDGDQPGVQMNLIRFVRGIGLTPLVSGNIKGLQDPYRTPTTQAGFAAQWGQDAWKVTSFADGTKVSVEQAIVANAAGFTVHRRGMLAMEHRGHVDELVDLYDVDELAAMGGAVDYTIGSLPAPGVFVLARMDDPRQQHYLRLYKLGDGPVYSFYTPYHLCHFEAPATVARAVLLDDACFRPLGAPRVDVVTTAKTDLVAGTVLDASGGYHYFGEAEKAEVAHADGALPVGLAEGCVLLRDLAKDDPITLHDVRLPDGLLSVALRREQDLRFFGSSAISAS
ncbi:NAD(P)H-dependent oxidoreductase [Nocardioides flavescens]|uniref:NAD(P)-dependent oxidoreductase n=1 Tax=Nocardioides flavescens TaxID=2691959 RepID=A0A6L7F0H2_9ACTN|nr:SAF domain-containing protein [Nocardioides flavescens]MXG89941.1 NAD(P)-dependent oxidoreductase [Nocardioides flavescens]